MRCGRRIYPARKARLQGSCARRRTPARGKSGSSGRVNEFPGETTLTDPVSLRRDGNVAIITIDNPPVNALRHGVRKGIMENVIAARDDASVEAIILTG